MPGPRYTHIHLLLAAGIGAALAYAALKVTEDRSIPQAQVAPVSAPHTPAVDIEQLRKDMSTRFIGDPRTLGEKLRDFVAENPIAQTIPLACKVIADLAENPDALGNQELDVLYHNQTDPDLKRVIAQVLSLRGDNHLLEDYISKIEIGLHSDAPDERRKTLQTLAKTHYASAANVLIPLLQDEDTSVKLEALLALRSTGNESHIHHLQALLNHPDPSVSWLANDALNQLQYLSKKARTRVVLGDITSGLPL